MGRFSCPIYLFFLGLIMNKRLFHDFVLYRYSFFVASVILYALYISINILLSIYFKNHYADFWNHIYWVPIIFVLIFITSKIDRDSNSTINVKSFNFFISIFIYIVIKCIFECIPILYKYIPYDNFFSITDFIICMFFFVISVRKNNAINLQNKNKLVPLIISLYIVLLPYIVLFYMYLNYRFTGKTYSFIFNKSVLFNSISYIIFACILTPIYEEIFFSYFLQNYVIKKLNVFMGLIVVSFLFMLAHYDRFSSPDKSVILSINMLIAIYFFNRLFISYFYYKTNNLLAVIIMHSAINFINFDHLEVFLS